MTEAVSPFPYSLLSSSWNLFMRLLTDERMVPRYRSVLMLTADQSEGSGAGDSVVSFCRVMRSEM